MKKPETKWTKIFRDYARQGQEVNAFFIPVRRDPQRNQLECWFVLFAPFAWIFYVLKNVCQSVIIDCLNLLSHLDASKKKRK